MDKKQLTQADIYDEMCAILNANNIADMLGWMAAHGQSVSLDYDEDNQHWVCSWVSGKRFTGIRRDIPNAIRDAVGAARTDYLMRFGEEADGNNQTHPNPI